MKKQTLLSLVCGLFACTLAVNGQTFKKSLLYDFVQQKRTTNFTVAPVQLFRQVQSAPSLAVSRVVAKSNTMAIDAPAAGNAFAAKAALIEISIPVGDSKYVLELAKQDINTSNNFTFGTLQNNFTATATTTDQGLHYRGYVNGDPTSLACISIFANGEVAGLFSTQGNNFVFGRTQGDDSQYIVYIDKNITAKRNFICSTPDEAIGLTGNAPASTHSQAAAPAQLCKKVRFYWEADYALYTLFGKNLNSVQNYLTGVFNQVATMYQNEGIIVELSQTYVWTSKDPYHDTSSAAALDDFKAHWNATGNNFNGDIAHLVSGSSHNNGGRAYIINDMCGRTYNYGYSNVWGSFNTVPVYSWDVEVLTHETGHNLGSNHTHWCGWNTGAGGTCGAIDNCAALEAGSSCTTCTVTTDVKTSLPAGWQGTVMSYCHLVSGVGINLANGFGPLPQNVLRNTVSNTACLKSIIAATLTASPICGTGTGSVILSYDGDNFGKSPYKYVWSPGGATTKDVTGIKAASTYTVVITDANNCQSTLAADVKKLGTPGNGIPYAGKQPICCTAKADSITLSATPAIGLNSCQTVAWLRLKTPDTTYALAKAAFAKAADTDIIFSVNPADIAAAKPARVRMALPRNCSAASTWYYVPFVSQKPKAALNISQTHGTLGGVTGGDNTVIGNYAVIDDQSSALTACNDKVTPTINLTVKVTAYTGRANHMYIVLRDIASSKDVYFSAPLAGVGTYTIPAANIPTPLASYMILVYDYNCSTTCVGSTATFTVTRQVIYPAITKPTFEEACTTGTPITLKFSPTGCTALPVVLRSFDISASGCDVTLAWQTATELNNKGFEIEQSANSGKFATFGFVPGHGTTGIGSSYKYTISGQPADKYYYRLKQVDANGNPAYTETKEITTTCAGVSRLSVYPNPSRGEYSVTLSNGSGIYKTIALRVYDFHGKLVKTIQVSNYRAGNKITVNLTGLASGSYYLTANDNDKVLTQKLELIR